MARILKISARKKQDDDAAMLAAQTPRRNGILDRLFPDDAPIFASEI
jgi:hypothetical protein